MQCYVGVVMKLANLSHRTRLLGTWLHRIGSRGRYTALRNVRPDRAKEFRRQSAIVLWRGGSSSAGIRPTTSSPLLNRIGRFGYHGAAASQYGPEKAGRC